MAPLSFVSALSSNACIIISAISWRAAASFPAAGFDLNIRHAVNAIAAMRIRLIIPYAFILRLPIIQKRELL
jgi:hypothetical protein